MKEKIKNFIIKLQNSDEATKKTWAVVGTGVSMLLITTIWFLSIDLSFNTDKIKQEESKSSFVETFSTGLKIAGKEIGSEISKAVNALKNYASETKSVQIQTANINFITDNLPEIKPKNLP